MKKLLMCLVIGVMLSANAVGAVIYDNSIAIPDANVLTNYNGSGLDWVYAGPIATNEWGVGNIYAPSYRAAEGWRFATATEWETKPLWTDFIQPGYSTADVPASDSYTDHAKYKFASEYWGNFYHVDLNDAAAGRVTNGLDIGSLNGVYETWYVRDSDGAAPVPEPGTMILLGFGMAGLAIYGKRRHNNKA